MKHARELMVVIVDSSVITPEMRNKIEAHDYQKMISPEECVNYK